MHKILVVDDELAIIESYKRIFSKVNEDDINDIISSAQELLNIDMSEIIKDRSHTHAYDVLEASSGDRAVDMYRRHHSFKDPIKVVFMDFQMPPGITGLQAANNIRKINPNVQIVFVTVFSEASLLSEDDDTKNTLILKKPYEKIEVLQIAASLTKKYDLKRTYDTFLSQVSHELKTPLVSILGFSDLLMEDETISQENRDFLKMINSSAHLLDTLVNDMFTFMLLKERKMTLNKKPLDVSQFLKTIHKKATFLFKLRSQELDFILDLPEKDCEVVIDQIRVEQVLTNLLSNAYKFTERGIIKLGYEIRNNKLVFFVDDSGIGIDRDKFRIALTEFERLEDYSPQPGLGLGLTICHGIVIAHGGQFDIIDKDEGARFEVILPLD